MGEQRAQVGGEPGGHRSRPGCELPRASQPHSPRSWCQVLRGGVGAREGDGWRLSSLSSRNANSARNGEATGGGGEALRLPQPLRCRRDFASRQRELRARPPPPPLKLLAPAIKASAAQPLRLARAQGQLANNCDPSSQRTGQATAICQRGRPRPSRTAPRTADAGRFKAGSGNASRPEMAAPVPAESESRGPSSPRPLSRSPLLPAAGWAGPVQSPQASRRVGGRERGRGRSSPLAPGLRSCSGQVAALGREG